MRLASRRVAAMRLIVNVPEVENKISQGSLTLTVAAQAQRFFKSEEKINKKYTPTQKLDLLEKLENKSVRAVTQELIKISPQALPKERQRQLTEKHIELKLVIPTEVEERLSKLKNLLSHKMPNATTAEILDYLTKLGLETLDPEKKPIKPQRNATAAALSKNDSRSRYIPETTKRALWQRAQGQCEFVDPITKRRCSSQYKLETEHHIPFSLGGTNNLTNLKLYCSSHNKWAAIKVFGEKKMQTYLKL